MVEVAVAGLRGRAWVMQILTCGDFSHKKSISNIVESKYLEGGNSTSVTGFCLFCKGM